MTVFFIKESDEKNKLKLLFHKIRISDNIIELPINRKSKINYNKIKNWIIKHRMKIVVLSKFLNNEKQLKTKLQDEDIYIVDGTKLFKLLLEEIIEYIANRKELKLEQLELSILTNDISKTNKKMIINLAKKVKRLNIITNLPHIFKYVEEYLYNEFGIIIQISNNQEKALVNSDIIINMDLEENEFNLYKLPSNGIVINMDKKIRIHQKAFNGININNYSIIMPQKYELQNFEDKLVYESFIINKEYAMARKQILEDKIQIYLDKL